MTVTNHTILVVEDEEDMYRFHLALLDHAGLGAILAKNGKEAINILGEKHEQIDLILSDVLMPEMNGYEFCKAVKESEHTKDIPLMFVSALDTLEEKVKGYSYGADDYVIKPLEAQEVVWKIKRLISERDKKKNLSHEISETQKATMQIMNFYSDLGDVLEFYKESTNVSSYEELSNLLFNVTSKYSLNCTLQIHGLDGQENFCSSAQISPLELEVIKLARSKDERFLTIDSKLFINYERFTLFVKNMPVDDSDRCGTLRDSLGILCNAIEAKIESLLSSTIDSKKEMITESVKTVLEETKLTFDEIEQKSNKAMELMSVEIEDSFMSLGLSDEQENHIRKTIENCVSQTSEAFTKSKVLNEMFDDINRKLNEMLEIKR